MKFIFSLLSILASLSIYGQSDHSHRLGRVIAFPNIPGYTTLKTDLHQHTVFSDGHVWPDIRVQEALMDGLDAISLTEHLEYQPHKADIPHPDRNRSYQLAMEEAKDHNLMIVRGSEITRNMPPGHCNAIFITDANKLLIKDSVEVFREANRQGAFVFWNHPHWIAQRSDGMATLTPMHRMLIKEKLLHGSEVVNDKGYSDEALQFALDHNLTIMGTSDIHGLIDWEFVGGKAGHRPVTLVFIKDKTEAAVKDALMNRRTVAVFQDLLIGRDEFLVPLVKESLLIKKATYIGKSSVLEVTIENKTNTTFTLTNRSNFTFSTSNDLVTFKPGEDNVIEVRTKDKLTSVSLTFEILNAVNAPNKHPIVTWQGKVE
jgi:predicted metal-dependent phosphoesterase TrpH